MKNANDHKIIDKTITSDKYPEIYVVLRRLKYLALLPPDYIVNTFHQIKNDCKTDFGLFFDRYLDYYAKQWLRAEGPEQISVYRITENRTDNQLESYHKKINSVIKEQRPSHNLFLGKFKYYYFLYFFTTNVSENYTIKNIVDRFAKINLSTIFSTKLVKIFFLQRVTYMVRQI